MKIVVFGSSGMLGGVVKEVLSNYHEVVTIGRDRTLSDYVMDFRDFNSLNALLDVIKSDAIINCIALTDISSCEKNPSLAFFSNYTIPLFLSKRKEKLIHISTDSVFNGLTGSYDEISLPYPLNVYATSKLSGEYPVLSSNGLVVRTNIFGFNLISEGKSLFEWAANQISNNQPINGFRNVFFNPVSTFTLAEVLLNCLEKEITGLLNVGSKNFVSKFDFLQYVIEFLNSSYKDLQSSEYLDTDVLRPRNTTLITDKIMSFGIEMPELSDEVNKVVELFNQRRVFY